MNKLWQTKLILLASSVLVVNIACAHGGGRDSNGGHVDRSTGIYHCHTDDCVLPTVPTTEEDVADPPDGVDDDPITVAGSWGTTKAWARDTVYAGRNDTFYCGCDYTPSGRSGGAIDQDSCGYDGSNESHSARAVRLEWEHVVPASLMPARTFACWTDGLPACAEAGRECCEKHDLNARVMIFDLHNLVPSIGQPNALRSNKRYGLIEGEERLLGDCDFEWTDGLAEPADDKRGDVARVWLYFVSEYGLQLQQGELEMYLQWSNEDPPVEAEFVRNDRIREKQGNGNPFVEMFPRPD